ncbi:MAG TPA: cytochrome P460 family protein [Polyangiaceae bacterium]
MTLRTGNADRSGTPAFWTLVNCLFLFTACGGDNQDDAGARDLLARLQAEDYRSWERAPGWPSRQETGAPHGDTVDIYVNDVIEGALLAAAPLDRWPEGSVVVKDGWDGSDLEIVAVMEKRSDGWYWAEYDDAGEPDYSGHPDICIDCHRTGSDFVRAFRLP